MSIITAKSKRFITSIDLAKFFEVSRHTIVLWAKNGILPPPLAIGGRFKWDREAFEKWLAEKQGAANVG